MIFMWFTILLVYNIVKKTDYLIRLYITMVCAYKIVIVAN